MNMIDGFGLSGPDLTVGVRRAPRLLPCARNLHGCRWARVQRQMDGPIRSYLSNDLCHTAGAKLSGLNHEWLWSLQVGRELMAELSHLPAASAKAGCCRYVPMLTCKCRLPLILPLHPHIRMAYRVPRDEI